MSIFSARFGSVSVLSVSLSLATKLPPGCRMCIRLIIAQENNPVLSARRGAVIAEQIRIGFVCLTATSKVPLRLDSNRIES